MRQLVSVIVPTYNGAAFLAQAVESIRAQEYDPIEILIVDDGSTDETLEIVRGLGSPVQYFSHSHSGKPAVGRNRGLAKSKGSLIAFLDQDDLWPPSKLRLETACFTRDPQLQVVGGYTQRLELVNHSDGASEFRLKDERIADQLVSGALFRREVFDIVGGFDESLRFFGDDTDWFLRARELDVPMLRIDAVTLIWRIHAHNTTHTPGLRDHAHGIDRPLTEVLKKARDRRRQRGEIQ